MPISIPPQTPLYYSEHRDKYSRQQMIKDIQDVTGRELIAYVANIHHPAGGIDQNDVLAFGDLMHDKADKDLDLLLQSPGGDIDIAEKIIYMCRSSTKSFRVIVAESAKSAATLIALGADEIVMGYISELGPIDPQVSVTTASGEPMDRPARSFLDGLKAIQKEVNRAGGRLSPVYFPLLQQLDPALLDFCEKAILRSRRFAIKWLTKHQCEGDSKKAKEIADKLLNPKRYLSHGTVIDYKEASDELGLCVKYLPPQDPLWQACWRLYCNYESDMRANELAKIFESSTVSLPFQ
jgi:hypothetical protein